MSVSPFRTTTKPYLEVAAPTVPDVSETCPLEDVPFESKIEEFPQSFLEEKVSEELPHVEKPKTSWLTRLFSGRAARQQREKFLENEIRDLRASYAGLLHGTEDIRERLDEDAQNRGSMQRALSPFPAAVAGIASIQTRQEEAGEVLLTIREHLETTAERDEEVMASLGFLTSGVGDIQSGVGEVVQGQGSLLENLGTLSTEMETRLTEVKSATQESSERLEKSSDDVLTVLKTMEANHQRGLWIFGSLLAALFVALVCFAAKLGSMAVIEDTAPDFGVTAPSVEPVIATDAHSVVLDDELEF